MSSRKLDRGEPDAASASRINLRAGWWGLLVFLTLGLGLEALNGFKIQFYLGVASETRRTMWTLAHAHGTLLSLINIAFGLSAPGLAALGAGRARFASRCLLGALYLLPAGFFLGGAWIYAGDPGLGIVLVPLGGILLLIGVLMTARATRD